MSRLLLSYISLVILYIIFLIQPLEASPWLEDYRNGEISASAFITSNLSLSSYKGYLNYGISNNFNISGSSMYEPNKAFFTNELSVKAKFFEKYFDHGQFILSTEIMTKNVISDNDFYFINNKAFILAGLKLGSIFVTFEPSVVLGQKDEYSEIGFSIGYDYSYYSTIIVERVLSSVDQRWKIALIKSLIGNFDLSLEYFHHVDGYDKFSIGLWCRVT